MMMLSIVRPSLKWRITPMHSWKMKQEGGKVLKVALASLCDSSFRVSSCTPAGKKPIATRIS